MRAGPRTATCSASCPTSEDGVAESGRDPASLPITVFGVAEDLDLIKRYRDAGVARLIFNLPPAKADEVLPLLDRCAALMRQASA